MASGEFHHNRLSGYLAILPVDIVTYHGTSIGHGTGMGSFVLNAWDFGVLLDRIEQNRIAHGFKLSRARYT